MHNSYKLLTKKHRKYGIPDIYILHKTIQELRRFKGKVGKRSHNMAIALLLAQYRPLLQRENHSNELFGASVKSRAINTFGSN
ncbi:MAG TPA: hypothetical protein DDW76_15935 [Cyanobacteria bacterium UBA11369]|nr:hypothetical protein [Cyanobacteria bacterium UBA11371]HBE33111.1 hypothetical protein [Cyanobacteria bacterium UBA11368]HBE50240.1 hypothetical protein [Cyanobacteria bacterium UBA11369]